MGRHPYSSRQIIEYSGGVYIRDLKNYGLLNQGPVTAQWNGHITRNNLESLAEVTFSVQILYSRHHPHNNFIHFEYDHEGQHITFKHIIEIQPVHFGGYRYFFRCCCKKNGIICGRRVKALYFGGHIWACRHCLELVYQNCRYSRDDASRYRNNAEILQKKAEVLRKYRHPRKANLLHWKAWKYLGLSDQAFTIKFQRRFGKYS